MSKPKVDDTTEFKEKAGKDHAEEYQILRKDTARDNTAKEYSESFKTSEKNSDLNRYTNVPCYENTRVKLYRKNKKGKLKLAGKKDSKKFNDYIHANFVDGFNSSVEFNARCYIAAQGPNNLTDAHFWEMVVLYNVKTIVCLTNMKEINSLGLLTQKCEQYFPIDDKTLEFTKCADSKTVQINVQKTGLKSYQHYDYRKLQVEFKKKKAKKHCVRIVNHFFYKTWPDHGVPDGNETTKITDFMKDVRQKDAELNKNSKLHYDAGDEYAYLNTEQSPVLVHCSAGIGRTGTYILIDQAMHNIDMRMKTNKFKNVNKNITSIDGQFVFNMAKRVREQRYMAIQTIDQYRYCYQIVKSYLERAETNNKAAKVDQHTIKANKGTGTVPIGLTKTETN